MSRDDRNTAIIVIIVLVVCTISLVAIGSTLFAIVSPGIAALTNTLSLFVRTQTTTYNFPVPSSVAAVEEGQETDISTRDYNFEIPRI